MSEGMLLAAGEEAVLSMVGPIEDVPAGTVIR